MCSVYTLLYTWTNVSANQFRGIEADVIIIIIIIIQFQLQLYYRTGLRTKKEASTEKTKYNILLLNHYSDAVAVTTCYADTL